MHDNRMTAADRIAMTERFWQLCRCVCGGRGRAALECCVCLCLLVGYAIWTALPHFCDPADVELAKQTPVRTYYDREGQILLQEPTYDWQWRLDVPLEEVSPEARRVLLGIEDNRFAEHDGVDRWAILRACWANLRFARITSGASTITMQLVGMVLGRERTLARKLRQAACARRLEWRRSKRWILENYLNRIPFGGKIHGIEAASRYYFGHAAAKLTLPEATLLCGIPQRPNAYRPDRHRELAKERQWMVLHILVNNDELTQEEADRIFCHERLPYRDFSLPSPLKKSDWSRTEHLLQMARREARGSLQVHTSMNPVWQRLLLQTLQQHAAALHGVHDAAGVIIDNASGELVALVGTLDYDAKPDGQVNAAMCRRTAGSALKPFVYAEAVDGGLLTADTKLTDAPVRYGTYTPGNYDGTFADGVTASEALSRSLNTPAVRLVSRLGTLRVLEMFRRLGLHQKNAKQDTDRELAQKLGLSLVLGTAGYRLTDIAAAYTTLASGGRFQTLSCLHDSNREMSGPEIFTPGCCALVTKMLTVRQLPGCICTAAWKTGTSSGNRDAWCFAYTPEVTVGVWMGNKQGQGAPELVGSSAAAPCAGAIIEAIYRQKTPQPFDSQNLLVNSKLCARTGLRAVPGVCQHRIGQTVKGVPLASCDVCEKGEQQHVLILHPLPRRYLARPNRPVSLSLKTRQNDIHWYIDGIYAGQLSNGVRRTFRPGHHVVCAVSENQNLLPARVEFEVSEN